MSSLEFKEGTSENDPKPLKVVIRRKVEWVVERTMPTIWIGVCGYFLYAFCYVVLWRRVRLRDRGAAIALLCVYCVLNLYVVVAFAAIHAWGPGKITKGYTSYSSEHPDVAFVCDSQGYSLYCSYCKQIKPNRTHHASYTDTCVPVMDHFCPWVGNVIGQGNIKFFLQFSWSMMATVIYVLVVLFVFQHRPAPHINGNSIALYAVCGLVLAFLFVLLCQHTFYIMVSHTTLEHLGYRRGNLPYINLLWKDGLRRVVQPTRKDVMIPRSSPFDRGAWNNIVQVMGPVYTWVLPIRGPILEPQINETFLEVLRHRILD